MAVLSYEVLLEQGFEGYLLKEAPEKVLQFGEGNFLRAFVDYFIDVANETQGWNGKVVVVQPISNKLIRSKFVKQDNLYTLHLRGIEKGCPKEYKRVISCISRVLSSADEFDAVLKCAHNPDLRYIVSNTTEAGIVFHETDVYDSPASAAFPGKITRFLYERFTAFGTAKESGFVLLPCELIEDNGIVLKACVHQYIDLWKLPAAFGDWVDTACEFCATLVDRIVPGYPQNADELDEEDGYTDSLRDTAELFGFWAIEGRESLNEELPFAKANLPVLVTPNVTPYKQRKVRILNGAHTSSVCAALLCGLETVGEMMEDHLFRSFLNREIQNEIIPTLDLPKQELESFAASVIDRFQNPYIRHELITITLNSTSKWRARVLPSVTEYKKRFGSLPPLLTFSFAAYAAFMRSPDFDQKDDAEALEFFAAHGGETDEDLMAKLCAETALWGQNLSSIPGFLIAATGYLQTISKRGVRQALEELME